MPVVLQAGLRGRSGRGRPKVRHVLRSDHDGLFRGAGEGHAHGDEVAAGEMAALQKRAAADHEAQMDRPLALP